MIHTSYLSVSAVRLSIGSILAAFALTPLAYAQKETGPWGRYDTGSYIQFEKNGDKERYNIWKSGNKSVGGASYTWNSSTNTETFRAQSGSDYNRIEYRGRSYDEGSGVYQFQGEIRIPSSSNTNDVWVAQFWHAGLIKYNNGNLIYHPASLPKPSDRMPGWNRDNIGDSEIIARDIKGKWIKVNIIHDVKARKVKIYINDTIEINRSSFKVGNEAEYYFKYGAYDTSGSDTEVVEWRNTKIWKKN